MQIFLLRLRQKDCTWVNFTGQNGYGVKKLCGQELARYL